MLELHVALRHFAVRGLAGAGDELPSGRSSWIVNANHAVCRHQPLAQVLGLVGLLRTLAHGAMMLPMLHETGGQSVDGLFASAVYRFQGRVLICLRFQLLEDLAELSEFACYAHNEARDFRMILDDMLLHGPDCHDALLGFGFDGAEFLAERCARNRRGCLVFFRMACKKCFEFFPEAFPSSPKPP